VVARPHVGYGTTELTLVNTAQQFDTGMVIAAVLNRLKPSIGASRDFTPRWSCPIRLFRYFEERTFVPSGIWPSAFISRTARCDAA
jgi:hypothetical protein